MFIVITIIVSILNLLILRRYVKRGELKNATMESIFYIVLLYIIPIVNIGMLISNCTDILSEYNAETILKKIFFIKE